MDFRDLLKHIPQRTYDMRDVSKILPTDGQALVYDEATQTYIPGTVSGGGGIETGTTFPASPTQGAMFYKTDIKTLFQYESAWKAIISYGAVNLYVDATNGSDAVGKGYGSGTDACATIQYAIDLIPPINGGNVIVNVTAGTYRETVTIQGKSFSGAYSITVNGTLTNITSGTATAGTTTTLTSALNRTLNQDQGRIIRITSGTGTGLSKIIASNTAGPNSVYTIAGSFNTTPDNTSVFSVDDCGTRITGSNAGADTTAVRTNAILVVATLNVNINNVLLNYATTSGANYSSGATGVIANAIIHNCNSRGVYTGPGSYLTVNTCYAYSDFYGFLCDAYSTCKVNNAWIKSNTTQGFLVGGAGYLVRSLVESNGTDGAGITVGGVLQMYGAANANTFKNNGGWGIICTNAGQGYSSSAQTYSGNVSGTYTPTTALAGGNS